MLPALPSISSAIAYLPKGVLMLRGTGLKYLNTLTLEHTGITFGTGTPSADGSWIFTAQHGATYNPVWEHQTMAIEFTLQPPDPRTDAVEADVEYAPAPAPSPSPATTSVPRFPGLMHLLAFGPDIWTADGPAVTASVPSRALPGSAHGSSCDCATVLLWINSPIEASGLTKWIV